MPLTRRRRTGTRAAHRSQGTSTPPGPRSPRDRPEETTCARTRNAAIRKAEEVAAIWRTLVVDESENPVGVHDQPCPATLGLACPLTKGVEHPDLVAGLHDAPTWVPHAPHSPLDRRPFGCAHGCPVGSSGTPSGGRRRTGGAADSRATAAIWASTPARPRSSGAITGTSAARMRSRSSATRSADGPSAGVFMIWFTLGPLIPSRRPTARSDKPSFLSSPTMPSRSAVRPAIASRWPEIASDTCWHFASSTSTGDREPLIQASLADR